MSPGRDPSKASLSLCGTFIDQLGSGCGTVVGCKTPDQRGCGIEFCRVRAIILFFLPFSLSCSVVNKVPLRGAHLSL